MPLNRSCADSDKKGQLPIGAGNPVVSRKLPNDQDEQLRVWVQQLETGRKQI
jgi:hypothetical protein